MAENTKKYLAILFAIVSLIIVVTIFYRTFSSGSGSGGGKDTVYLLCKSCGPIGITQDEFREIMMTQPGGMMPPMMGGPMLFNCPECGQKSCAVAQKCQKCDNIFITGQAQDPRYPDRCPKCGFSAIEDRQKKR